jgi:hypothetical protein
LADSSGYARFATHLAGAHEVYYFQPLIIISNDNRFDASRLSQFLAAAHKHFSACDLSFFHYHTSFLPCPLEGEFLFMQHLSMGPGHIQLTRIVRSALLLSFIAVIP